jgi:hypothetical protein
MTIRRLFTTLFALALVAMPMRETLDPDMWWHLRTGEVIWQSGIPRHDIFSFTVPHHEWVTHEWLSQLVMWLVYLTGGLPGLIVAFALLTAVSFWLVYRCSAGQPYLAAFVVLLAAIASAIVWGARPQIFNILLAALFVYVVERVKDGQLDPRWLWSLPLVTLVWANLHSGYLLGVVLLGTYTVAGGLERYLGLGNERTFSLARLHQMALVTGASFLLAAVNPSGPSLWLYPFETLGSGAMQSYIQEWHSPNFHLVYFWPFAALVGLGGISWAFSPQRPTWSDLLLFCGTAAAGLVSARHIPLFAVVATPIVCRHLSAALWTMAPDQVRGGRWTADHGRWTMDSGSEQPLPSLLVGLNWLLVGLALMGVLVWTATTLLENETAVAERYPVTAVDFLEAEGLADAPGYNSYNWGGYLIWRGLPVFVDGRADVYGDDFLFYYLQTFEVRANWRQPLEEYNVAYVLIEPGSPLTAVLTLDEQWHTIYQDDIAHIFLRR